VSTFERIAPPHPPNPRLPNTTPPRRRRRYVLASVLAFMLVAVGIGFWWTATRFAPLSINGGSAHVRVEVGNVTRVDALLPSGEPFVAFHVPYRNGKWLDTGFTLINEGPFPIMVDQIGFAGEAFPPTKEASVRMSLPPFEWGPGPPDQMVPFRPFTLGSDEGRYVFVRHQFFGCTLGGSQESAVTWARETVKFRIRVGWMDIHRSEALPMSYSIYASGREGCTP
jgi:hypothetical protein